MIDKQNTTNQVIDLGTGIGNALITDLGYEGIRERIVKGTSYISPYKPRLKGREEIAGMEVRHD
ncbi:hypothetical protein [Methylobacter tundripaludum]|uniref:hypothetical protein n=1 Tax=Methylobacter tundripaludum TaxID=173365 RepID=UPI0004DEDC9D|nr:hypothetical protein [Methylobacter tundripaludum]